MARFSIPDFQTANPLYAGASVSVFTVDGNGAKTATKATIYDDVTGSGTLSNPLVLDGEGKWKSIPYVDEAVIMSVTPATGVAAHDTGLITGVGSWRGDWVTATVYYPGDFVRDGANGDDTKDIYISQSLHTSGTWATDAADSTKLALALDISVIIALLDIPDVSGATALDYLRVNSGATAYEFLSRTEVVADLFTKGGDIASASPLVIDTDGGFFDVTGTTNFAAMTVAAGRLFALQFDGALTITHGSGIDLPGGANITTAAGDRMICVAEAANTVQVLAYFPAGGYPGLAANNTLTGNNTFSGANTFSGISTFSAQARWAKGSDVASASPLVLGTDGNYFDVTGTTNFAAITVAAGTLFMLQFDGALTITHGSGIDLPGGANVTTAAGDVLIGFATAADTVTVLALFRASGRGLKLPSPDFTSSLQTVTVDTKLNVAHGLGAMPTHFEVYLVANTTTAQGYASGARIIAASVADADTGDRGAEISADATNVTIHTGVTIEVKDLTSHNSETITTSEYNWLVLAWA